VCHTSHGKGLPACQRRKVPNLKINKQRKYNKTSQKSASPAAQNEKRRIQNPAVCEAAERSTYFGLKRPQLLSRADTGLGSSARSQTVENLSVHLGIMSNCGTGKNE